MSKLSDKTTIPVFTLFNSTNRNLSKMKHIRIFAFFLILIFFSCEKEKNTPINENFNNGVFILNEGNFQWENSSVSFYSFNSKNVNNHIFYNKNQKKLGDVAQSMTIKDSLAYIVVNNSQKIEIVNIKNFQSVGTIYGFTSPRYIQILNNQKAYVTDLYSNTIQIVNLEQKSISSKINCNAWCEQMFLFDNKLFVANVGKNQILIINTVTDEIIDSINTSAAANSLVIDKNEKIWALCGNIYGKSGNASLIRFDPENMNIEITYQFGETNATPTNLRINSSGDTLFFANNNIYRMSINDLELPEESFISANKNNIYGFGINPNNSDIYFTDALDYLQNGIVFRYSQTGILLDSFNVGIIPQFLCFN